MQMPPFQTNEAIRKMRLLLSEVRQFSENHVTFDAQSVKNTQYQINQAIREIFGPDSPEFNEHKHHNWLCSYRMKDDDSVKQKKFAEGIPKMISMLETLTARLENLSSQETVHGH